MFIKILKILIIVAFFAELVIGNKFPKDFVRKKVEEIIKKHNEYRKLHGVQPLKHDQKLDKFAQNWADKLANGLADKLAGQNKSSHRSEVEKNPYGENIYKIWASGNSSYVNKTLLSTNPTKSWYDEIKYVREWPIKNLDRRFFHFTQVISKRSQYIGCGVSTVLSKDSGQQFVVCNYDPHGNLINTISDNVPAPLPKVASHAASYNSTVFLMFASLIFAAWLA